MKRFFRKKIMGIPMWLILIGVGVVVVMKNPAAKQKLTDFWNSLKGKLSGGASA